MRVLSVLEQLNDLFGGQVVRDAADVDARDSLWLRHFGARTGLLAFRLFATFLLLLLLHQKLVLDLLLVERAVGSGLSLDLGLHRVWLLLSSLGTLSRLGSLALGLLPGRLRLLALRSQALHDGAVAIDGDGSFALSFQRGRKH